MALKTEILKRVLKLIGDEGVFRVNVCEQEGYEENSITFYDEDDAYLGCIELDTGDLYF